MAFIRPIIKGGAGTDVSDTTAVATDVLASKDFYIADGTKTTGTIATYAGDTEITENGTLETEGKYLASDVVVNVSGGGEPNFLRIKMTQIIDGNTCEIQLETEETPNGFLGYIENGETQEINLIKEI